MSVVCITVFDEYGTRHFLATFAALNTSHVFFPCNVIKLSDPSPTITLICQEGKMGGSLWNEKKAMKVQHQFILRR